jgi:protein CpxP
MSIRKPLLAAALALAIAPALVPLPLAFAQTAASTTAQQPPLRPSRIEGRLAFLKTELKITDAQTAQWNAFADVVRQNDQLRRARFEQTRASRPQAAPGQPATRPATTAIERLERQQQASEARADELKRYVAAFRPLYATMSDDQKKTADELVGGGGRGQHRRHGRF